MPWQIAAFPDQSVSPISVKWLKRNGKKCYFPKTKILSKLKKEAEVNKKSEKWGLYSCRILMNGETFKTLEEAREAELIAQNHSTMSSYEKSKQQQLKKRRNKSKSSSDSESEIDDFKKIDNLSCQDAASIDTTNKEYVYHSNDRPGNNDSNSSPSPSDESSDSDVNDDPENQNIQQHEEDDADGHESIEGSEICGDDDNGSSHCGRDNEMSNENGFDVDNTEYAIDSDDVLDIGNNLESTSEVQNPAAAYDFSDDRCLLRIEKLIAYACQELKTIKNDVKALEIKSSKTEYVVENLVTVCKDLAAEVFSCTEELKKRNGMFTDLLIPNLKLPETKRKHFKRNEIELETAKIADNLIKFLASTINESNESRFIQSCLNAIFDINFLTNKVWWKSEPGKVCIKKSRTLNCIKESLLMKFGLGTPKKTDKDVERLIYKVCRNMKDLHRKSLKAQYEKIAKNVDFDELKRNKEKSSRDHVGNDQDDDEDRKNYEERRKARKAARKARLAAEKIKLASENANAHCDAPAAKRSRKRPISVERSETDVASKKLKKKH